MTINEIKQRLSPIQVAEAAGVELHGDGEERPISCPMAKNHNTGDTKPSASLNVEKGLWQCHKESCGAAGDLIDLYMAAKGCDLHEALADLTVLAMRSEGREEVETFHPRVAAPDVEARWSAALDNGKEELIVGDGPVARYLAERLDPDAAVVLLEHGIAGAGHPTDPSQRLLAVPLFDQVGKVADIEYRTLSGKTRLRVQGAAAGQVLFFGGPDQLKAAAGKPLVIAEGSTDYLAVRAAREAVASIPGAKTAARVGAVLRSLLTGMAPESRPSRIVIATDADVDGDLAAQALAKALHGLLPLGRYRPPEALNDVAEVFNQKSRSDLLVGLAGAPVLEVSSEADLDEFPDDDEPLESSNPPAAPTTASAGGFPSLLSPPELRSRVAALGPASFLFKPFWPAGEYAVLGGQEKLGKSLVVAEMMVCTAGGRPLFDRFDCGTPGPAIYFSGEGGERSLLRRLDAIARSKNLAFDSLPLYVCSSVPHLTSMNDLKRVALHIDRIKPSLVAFDPLYLAAAGAKMTDLYAMGEVFSPIQKLCEAAGSSLLLVTHFNKTGTGSGPDRFVGAGPAQWGRVLMTLSSDRPKGVKQEDGSVLVELVMEVRGMQIDSQTYTIKRTIKTDNPADLDSPLYYTTKAFDLDDEEEDAGPDLSPTQAHLMRLLLGVPGRTATQLTEALQATPEAAVKYRTVSENLNKLLEKGLARKEKGVGRDDLWFPASHRPKTVSLAGGEGNPAGGAEE